ncbi:MAG: fibronectin type III domain-containing protein, partial [Bacteroidales bacterium]
DGSPWAPQSNGTQGETRNNMRFEIVPQQMSCFSPTELSANNITSNSGDLTWTPRGSETSWEIEYRLATASEWTISGTSTNNFYTLNDLLAATDYQVRIRAVCGSEDLSTWKTISFTTLCETISTFPFYTGIDNANGSGAAYFPYCWLRKTTNSTQYPYVNKDQYST